MAQARATGLKVDWKAYAPPVPSFFGVRAFDKIDLGRARRLHRLDAVLPDVGDVGSLSGDSRRHKVGRRARALFADAQKMLKIVDEKWLTARAVVGFWPANSVVDDIELYADESRSKALATSAHAASADAARRGRPNLALADFVAPKESGVRLCRARSR